MSERLSVERTVALVVQMNGKGDLNLSGWKAKIEGFRFGLILADLAKVLGERPNDWS